MPRRSSLSPSSTSASSPFAGLTAAAGFLLLLANVAPAEAAYSLTTKYEGSTFLDKWTFWGNNDNLTHGNVDYVSKADSKDLAYVNSAGNVILKMDNTTTLVAGKNRRSVRIESQVLYPIGSLFVHDLAHIPYGCSTWPSAWSSSPNWPQGGEIDIMEGVNLQETNRMALHTTADCALAGSNVNVSYTGNNTFPVCDTNAAGNQGCGIADLSNSSYGADFAAQGGGVWVTELASTGVRIWRFDRKDVPSDLSNSSAIPDPASWPTPVGAWASDICDIGAHFAPQHLVFTNTLCGDWAGRVMSTTGCGSTTCTDLIPNPRNYDTAFFEIASLRVYFNPDLAANSTAAALVGFPSTVTVASGGGGTGQTTSGAVKGREVLGWAATVVAGAVVVGVLGF